MFDSIKKKIPDIAKELASIPSSLQNAGSKAGLLKSFKGSMMTTAISIAMEQILDASATAFENWVNRVEIARERTSQIFGEFDQQNSTHANRKKTAAQYADRYDELSKGVDLSTNQNISLSAEEYAEFLNISTHLANSFPELKKGIDENGNSILNLGTKGNVAKKQLEELLQKEEELNNIKIADNLKESFKGVYTYVEAGKKAEEKLKSLESKSDKEIGIVPDEVKNNKLKRDNYVLYKGKINNKADTNYAYAVQSAAQDFMAELDDSRRTELQNKGISGTSLFTMDENSESFNLTASLYALSEDEIELLNKKIALNVESKNDSVNSQLESQKSKLENQVELGESKWAESLPKLTAAMQSKPAFNNLKDPSLQKIAIGIVEGLDSSFEEAIKQYNPDPYEYVKDKIIMPMAKLENTDKKLLTANFQELFNLNLEDMNVDEARTNIQFYCSSIAKILGKSLPEVQKLLGFEDFFQTASKYDETIAYASGGNYKSAKNIENSKGYNQKDVIDAMAKNSINTDEEIDKFKEFLDTTNSLDEAVNAYQNVPKNSATTSLTFDEAWNSIGTSGSEEIDAKALETKERLLELAKAGKLTEKELSESSIANIFTDAGISIEEATKKINAMKSSADQLASMETGISSISTILSQKEENWSGKDTHLKGIDIGQLSSMPEDVRAQKKEYEHFVEVLSNGSSKMDECSEAANKLATAYINSNNFLSNLTDKNKDYYTSVLKQIGVENAEEVVMNKLNREKINAQMATFNLQTATQQDISSLGSYITSLDDSGNSLAYYTLQQQIANNNALDTSDSISNLQKLAKKCGVTGEAISIMSSLITNMNALKNEDFKKNVDQAHWGESEANLKGEISSDKKRLKKLVNKGTNKNSPKITFKTPTAPSNPKDKGNKKDSRQQFDWISRALDRLSARLDLVKAKYDNLFNNKKAKDSDSLLQLQNKNLDDQYKILKKTAEYQKKAQKKYSKKADKVHISKDKKEDESLKKAVRQGRIKGNKKDLIASYGEKKAEKIQKYQNWYDKAREAEKNKISANTARRENRIQKYQGIADNADEKKSLAQSQKENATTAADKNNFIKKEKESVETSYNNQIKIANLKRDSLKADQLRVEKTKELLDLEIEQHQNLADEYQGTLDQYNAEKELAAKASEKNAIISQEEAKTRELYAEKITIADLEGNISEQKQLEAELNKQLRDFDVERHQNLADEIQAELDKFSAEKENLQTAGKKNAIVDNEKALTEKLYAEKIAIAHIEGRINEEQQLQAELTRKMAVLEKEKFDNIAHQYENLMKLKSNSYTDLSNAVDELEARGLIVSSELYSSQIAINNEKKKNYEEELLALNMQLHSIEEETDEWYAAQDAIQSCENGIAQCTKDSYALAEAIRNVNWQLSEKITSRLGQISSEYDLLIKLMSDKKLTDDKTGNFTKEGTATLGAYYSQLILAQQSTEAFKSSLDNMWDKIQRGEEGYTDQAALDGYYEKYDEYAKMIGNEYDLRKSLIDLMKEKYQAELDYLQDVINKRNELLQAEKDAYEYQRSIEEKTKNITTIQKQITALNGDDSEAAKSRLQQLQVSLDEANKDLQDTEYQQWISDQQTMLDNLYNEYSDFIDSKLNDTDALLQEAVNYLGDINISEDVAETLEEYAAKYNYKPTEDFNKINDSLGEKGSISTAVNSIYKLISDHFNQQIKNEEDAEKVIKLISEIGQVDIDGEGRKRLVAAEQAYTALSPEARRLVDSAAVNGLSTLQQKQSEYNGLVEIKKQEEARQQEEVAAQEAAQAAQQEEQRKTDARNSFERMIKETYWQDAHLHGGKTSWSTSTLNGNGTTDYGQVQQRIYNHGLKRDDKPYVNAEWIKEACFRLGYPRPAWSAGTLLNYMNSIGFSNGGIAKTLQKVPSMNGDEGWITVKRGEAVLTPEQTAAFQKLLKNLDMLNPAVDLYKNLQIKNARSAPERMISQSTGDINIDMSFPGVTNYEEFRQKLQSDPKIESMFKSMIWNKGSLSKYNTKM